MQSNYQGLIPTNRNLINQSFVPDYENSTSTKTFKQLQSNAAKSPPASQRTISPLSQMLQIKNIKNDEFLFRMKLKFIACMQQLQISKEDIEALRKQQSDSDVLSAFIAPVKKEFAGLKKLKDEYMVKENKNHSMKSIKSVESLQMISLESQIQQITESQKKLKHRCQRLFTENAQLLQKLKKKQHEFEQSENSLYQTKLLLKEYESVIENLKLSAKKAEKDFLSEKDRLNEELNAFRELMLRQREAKQIYLSKLDHCETVIMEKDDTIKRITDEVDFLKKQCIKWKNRSEWRENETSQQSRINQQKQNSLQQQIQKLKDTLRAKESQVAFAKKQTASSTEVFNKKLETIVEEWKTKLIETIQEYEATIEAHCAKAEQMENQVQALNEQKKYLELMSVENGDLAQDLLTARTTIIDKEQKISSMETQLKETLAFYPQKVKELESIIAQLKSENHFKSISIDQSVSSMSALNIQAKSETVENERLRQQLMNRQNELKKINEAKKDTQNQLLKRVSTVQNNRIIQISKLKVQYDEKIKQLEKSLKNTKELLQKYERQIKIEPKRVHLGSESSENIAIDHTGHQDSHMKSSIPSVNNSFNTGLNDRANDRTNRLITETYMQPQKKSSVRRIFVRSNSINEYLKQKLVPSTNEQTKDKLPGNISENFSFSNNSDSIQVKQLYENHI